MINQYVLYINNLKTNTTTFGKSSRHEEDAICFVQEQATNMVKADSGERHLQATLHISTQDFDTIKDDNKYPSGLYIKQYKHYAEIYEKKIKEPTFTCTITKSVVYDYKFINRPSIKCTIDTDRFPVSNLYGFVVSKNGNKCKLYVKDTFRGTIYNYDDVKLVHEFVCEEFYMSKPDQIIQHNNNDVIYYVNHDDESFIVELVKGIVSVKQVDQCTEFNLVTVIGYDKIAVELPYSLNKSSNNNTNNSSASKAATLKVTKSDHGSVFSQLGDIFKKYDVDNDTEQFRPSMLLKKKETPKPAEQPTIVIEKIVEKDVTQLVELSSIKINTLTKLYFEYIHDIEHNMIQTEDNPSIKKYITSLNDILNLNLSDMIALYKLASERLPKIIKMKNIDLSVKPEPVVECKKKLIKKKFKKPTRCNTNSNQSSITVDDELFSIYSHNKEDINNFLINNNYDVSALDNIVFMNQYDINYWSRVLNFALKNVDIKYITVQEISKLYSKYRGSFDKYFDNNNIVVINNFQELLEWNELGYDDICYLTDIFLVAIKYVDIVNNKIGIKDITTKN